MYTHTHTQALFVLEKARRPGRMLVQGTGQRGDNEQHPRPRGSQTGERRFTTRTACSGCVMATHSVGALILMTKRVQLLNRPA
jgi:hypothetical protein